MSHSISKAPIQTQRLCFFFVIVVLVTGGRAQALNSSVASASRIAIVSARNALAYNNSTKLVRGYDGQIHLVYHDEGEIFYTTSTNGGATWNLPINISNSAGESVFPALAVDSTRKHFIWQDDSDPNDLARIDGKQRIWFKSFRQANNHSLRFPYPIGESVGDVLTPSLAVKDGKTLLAVWAADMGLTLGWEINVSTGSLIDNGLLDLYDWSYPAIPGQALGLSRSFFPSIAITDTVSYVAWQEFNVFDTPYAMFRYRNGEHWSAAQNLASAIEFPGTDGLGIPSLALSDDGRAFLGFGLKYYSPPLTVDDIFVVSYIENDTLEQSDGVQLSRTPEPDSAVKLAICFGHTIIAAWETTVENIGRIYFSKAPIDNYDKMWTAPTLISDPAISAQDPQVVAITPDTLLFVWLEGSSPPFEIVARKYRPSASSVDDSHKREAGRAPKSFEVAIFPNPAHTFASIEVTALESTRLSIKIFNNQGQMIKSVVEKEISSSRAQYSWDMTDEKGNLVANGLYFVIAQENQFRVMSKFVVLR